MKIQKFLSIMFFVTAFSSQVNAEALDAPTKAKVEAKLKQIQEWGKNQVIVDAVKSHNNSPSKTATEMTQDKWKEMSRSNDFVKNLNTNKAAEVLKKQQDETVAEAFVSGADGNKVALLAKTTNWSHKGKPKHDEPMAGKTWIGEVEIDKSTAMKQVQVAVPVLDGNKAIGSLVVGLSVNKLK